MSVGSGLAPSPAPSLAAGCPIGPLALGSAPRTLGMGKWFWFPDPAGPGPVPSLLSHIPSGPGAAAGCLSLWGVTRGHRSDAPPGGHGPGGVPCGGSPRSAGLGASCQALPTRQPCSEPWRSTPGPSWPPHPARKPRGMVGLGEGRGAPGISLLFTNHGNDSCCLAQPSSASCSGADAGTRSLAWPNTTGTPTSTGAPRETWHGGMGAGRVKHAGRRGAQGPCRRGLWGPTRVSGAGPPAPHRDCLGSVWLKSLPTPRPS